MSFIVNLISLSAPSGIENGTSIACQRNRNAIAATNSRGPIFRLTRSLLFQNHFLPQAWRSHLSYWVLWTFASITVVAEEPTNKWRLHDLEFEHSPIENPLRTAFYLHRSYDVPCLQNSTETCWELTKPATICSWGYYGKTEQEMEWKSCWGYTNVPLGESDVPQDVQQWLKWRIMDFKESPASATSPNVTFSSMKIQVVNGVPVKS